MQKKYHVKQKKVLYYSILQYSKKNYDFLRSKFNVVELTSPQQDKKEILQDVALCFAPLGYYFDAAKMGTCQALEAIVTNTTGVPHIDMQAAQERNIEVISLKDDQAFLDSITATAEHTWGLLLALLRHTPYAFHAVLQGEWNRRDFGGSAMLSRLTLGIIGFGRLGRMVAQYAQAFGMKVKYFDPYCSQETKNIEKTATLEALVGSVDIVSLHIPSNEETYKIVSRPLLEKFKEGSYLINTSRGEVLDEDALLDVLKKKKIAGAALDVLDGEFLPGFNASQHPLVKYAKNYDNLIITPHIGGSTVDAWYETERRVINKAIAYLYDE